MDGLARSNGRDDVDLAILKEAPLAYRVLRDGVLLSCRDHVAYVQYRVRTLNPYFDFAPLFRKELAPSCRSSYSHTRPSAKSR
jgi:hypothetical protein